MLKAFLGFLVSVVVLLSSACVFSPAHAASATVIISQIQAGGAGAATQEFVAVYNNSTIEVDITNWCLTNKTNIVFACFTAGANQLRYLPPHSYAIAGSTALVTALASSRFFTTTYMPLSQSSGSITGGGDTVSLINQTGAVVDQHNWTTSLAGGTQLERRKQADPLMYIDTDISADWSVASTTHIPQEATVLETVTIDLCANIEGDQLVVPEGMVVDVGKNCHVRVIIKIAITELLPNAIGSDEGNEFIELFNPNDVAVDLAGYMLWVGPKLDVSYDFPTLATIPAHSYVSFSNTDIRFSLLNSSSQVRITTEDGSVVDESPAYIDPKDGASWALVGNVWQYTTLPTPGVENVLLAVDNAAESEAESTPTPCAVNQYRNPDTGRCRLLTSTGSVVTPCKDGQYRSEETNRCRNIAADTKTATPCDPGQERNAETGRCRKIAAASTPAPCKEGQERNLDTNRCRNSIKTPSADYAVLGAKAENGGSWYAWVAIGGILLLALGYAVWEWRDEVGKFVRKYIRWLPLFARLRK